MPIIIKSILEINEKDYNTESYPFLYCITNNNTEITKVLMEYTKKNRIELKINEKNKDGDYPLVLAIKNKYIKMTEILMKYANENYDILYFYEEDIEEISEIPDEILELFIEYEDILNIVYKKK